MSLKLFQNHGKYLMLALDHRVSFKKYINPSNPEAVTDADLVKTKAMIIESVQNQFSGVLVDPEWGLPAYTLKTPKGSLRDKPYLLPLEKSGYTDKKEDRITELEYSAKQIKDLGASGAKLLLYFNPEAKSCDQQILTAQAALKDSHKNKLPFFLEIVTYGNEELGKSRAEWVLRSLEMLLKSKTIPDVWKLEYPASAKATAGEAGSLDSCKKITKLVGKTPWILLTRGEKFAVFEKQLKDAVAAGAVGFLAGRALWQEIADYKTEPEKKEFLQTVVAKRFKKITKICRTAN